MEKEENSKDFKGIKTKGYMVKRKVNLLPPLMIYLSMIFMGVFYGVLISLIFKINFWITLITSVIISILIAFGMERSLKNAY